MMVWSILSISLVLAFLGLFLWRKKKPNINTALEGQMLQADLGAFLSKTILKQSQTVEEAKSEVKKILSYAKHVGIEKKDSPTVVLFVGVNGVGKTTSIGKLAALLQEEGRKVVLGGGDTFRAAAREQLQIWAERTGCTLVSKASADPAAVLFDAVNQAKREQADFVLCDTAGRLHTKDNLMEELKKVHRVLAKAMPGAPHEIFLVLDGTTGQNALIQAKEFSEAVPVTGIVLTKLDGTARGGIIVAITKELQIPIRFVGVGEGVKDLKVFDAHEFAEALFEN